MISSRSVLLVLGCSLMAGTGCFVNLADDLENAVEQLELEDPFEAELTVEGVETGNVRAGLFVATSDAELVASDGTTSAGSVDLDVDWAGEGRIDAYMAGATAATVQPLQAGQIDGDHVVFTLPELSADTDLVAVIWVDADGDGALDLSTDAASEAARTIVRDHDGAPHYLAHYSYDAADGNYSATAVGDADGTTSNLVLSRDQLKGWSVALDRSTDDPR